MVARTSARISKKFVAGKFNSDAWPLISNGFKLAITVSFSINSGSVYFSSLYPMSEGFRIDIPQDETHLQKSFCACSFKYHSLPACRRSIEFPFFLKTWVGYRYSLNTQWPRMRCLALHNRPG